MLRAAEVIGWQNSESRVAAKELRNLSARIKKGCAKWPRDREAVQCGFRDHRAQHSGIRALEIGARKYGAVKSILEKKLDGDPLHRPRSAGEVSVDHPNIRGPKYYH